MLLILKFWKIKKNNKRKKENINIPRRHATVTAFQQAALQAQRVITKVIFFVIIILSIVNEHSLRQTPQIFAGKFSYMRTCAHPPRGSICLPDHP